jgi:hypothetical protein
MPLRQRMFLALAVVPLGAFALVGTVAAQSSNDDSGSSAAGIIVLLIWVALVVGSIVFFVRNRQSFQVGTTTALPVNDVIQRALQTYTMNGWQVLSHAPDNASFLKRHKPSCLIAGVLLLLGIVPGIIYLVLGGRALTANVQARAGSGSFTTVEISGNARGFGGERTAQRAITALPIVSGVI